MPAFVVGFCEEMSPEPMYDYRAGVEATVRAYGGRFRSIVMRYRWEYSRASGRLTSAP